MWNFGIPYALKYYIDAIVQPGYLFRYLPDGRPEGLVLGRKMICVTSRGGDYSGYMKSFDFVVESYNNPKKHKNKPDPKTPRPPPPSPNSPLKKEAQKRTACS